MQPFTRNQFQELITSAHIRPRLRRELRYVPEEITSWEDRDFLTVTNKQGGEGILIYLSDTLPFSLQPRRQNAAGRIEAIICDICATWQRGTHSASITFQKESGSVSFLVCADLQCSLHVRGKTDASRLSKVQLRENVDTDGKVQRLQDRLRRIVAAVHGK